MRYLILVVLNVMLFCTASYAHAAEVVSIIDNVVILDNGDEIRVLDDTSDIQVGDEIDIDVVAPSDASQEETEE